jgi:3-deoxy-manno-octulosonate cytidylyltransferase (CMP-KDO synthetase)
VIETVAGSLLGVAAIAIIPARYASTRLPGKPLLRETGKFLIEHVVERVRCATRVGRVMVATDDERIAAAVRSFGGEAAMTRADHVSGTDRLAEVVRELGPNCADIVLNVQGDEPEIEPAALDRLVVRLEEDPACGMATLACPFGAEDDPRDPNCVKVVNSAQGRALYFSRALIPYVRDQEATAASGCWLLHLGVYGYRRSFLLDYAGWPQGTLERLEKLEQLRVLERGLPIAVEVVKRAAAGVDTPADYERFVARWRAGAAAADKGGSGA